jgi:hypothetical protein
MASSDDNPQPHGRIPKITLRGGKEYEPIGMSRFPF